MGAWQWFLDRSWPVKIITIVIGAVILGNVFGDDEETATQGDSTAAAGGPTAPEEPGAPEQAEAEPAKSAPAPEPEPAPEPAPEPEPEPVPEPEPEAKPVQIGQPLDVGEVGWVVTSARQRDQLKQQDFGEFGDTEQGNFVVVNFDFTNNSNEPLTLDSVSMTLIDKGGRESNPDTDTFGYVPADLDPFLEQVNPGVTEQGRLVFTVAPDASKFRLRLGDAAFLGSEEGLVRPGF